MNKAEFIAKKVVRVLKSESRRELDPDDALLVARVAVSALEEIHENSLRAALTRWEKLNREHRARSQPLPDYLSAALRDDTDQFSENADHP
jgi:hypothetical protein